MRKRFQTLKEDQKGFTLVELIVVLVILAIMAALLAPALLGYIDKARYSKYLEECRSISTAIQALNDEQYAKGKNPLDTTYNGSSSTKHEELNKLIYPTVLKSVTISYKGSTDTKDKYIVKDLTDLIFVSQDGSTVTATQTDGDWEVTKVTPASGSATTTAGSETGSNP